MTLEMRDRIQYEDGKIYGMIETLRELKVDKEEILQILLETEAISENTARQYLNEADDKLKQLHEFCAFRDRLYEIVFDLKSSNVRDEQIILKIQDEFGYDKDDAEFYFNYIVKTKNIL